jgi:hypothetical protein
VACLNTESITQSLSKADPWWTCLDGSFELSNTVRKPRRWQPSKHLAFKYIALSRGELPNTVRKPRRWQPSKHLAFKYIAVSRGELPNTVRKPRRWQPSKHLKYSSFSMLDSRILAREGGYIFFIIRLSLEFNHNWTFSVIPVSISQLHDESGIIHQ